MKCPKCLLLCSALMLAPQAFAGFLEMPETSEVPELKRETMLKDLDVPSVRERDPDPESGPRLNVTKFRIQGIVEYPDLGITREKINKLVESIRFDLMAEGELLDSGYTLDEISEISDLVADIEEETGDEHVSSLEVQRLVFLIRDQRRKRGVTLGMIETVADTITRYYRERGFILAKAYIPKQQVRDGVVTLTLLLGELGEVEVQKNKIYNPKTVQRIFKSLMDEPVTSDNIEERIYYVNDLPGLTAQGYFEPGTQVGDTKLNINVLNEKRFASNIRMDNHGSTSTGELRLYIDGAWNNPLGFGDRLHVALLNTFDPENSTFGSFKYTVPLSGPRFSLTTGYSKNAFIPSELQSDLGNSSIEAISEVSDVELKFQISRSRVKNTAITLRGAGIKTETDQTTENATNVELSYNFDLLSQKHSLLHQGKFTLVYSDFDNPDPVGFAAGEEKVQHGYAKFDYSLLKFINLPFFKDKKARWLSRFAAQYSGRLMSSINQFGVTGPSRARSFRVEDFFVDDGVYIGSDLVFQGPRFLDFNFFGERFHKVIQPFTFIDVAYGTLYNTENGSGFISDEIIARGTLVDIGAGLTLSYRGKLRSNLTFATPVIFDPDVQLDPGQDLTSTDLEALPLYGADGARVFMDLQYSF